MPLFRLIWKSSCLILSHLASMSTKHKIPHSRVMAKIMKINIFIILLLLRTGRIVPLQPVMGTLNMIFWEINCNACTYNWNHILLDYNIDAGNYKYISRLYTVKGIGSFSMESDYYSPILLNKLEVIEWLN